MIKMVIAGSGIIHRPMQQKQINIVRMKLPKAFFKAGFNSSPEL